MACIGQEPNPFWWTWWWSVNLYIGEYIFATITINRRLIGRVVRATDTKKEVEGLIPETCTVLKKYIRSGMGTTQPREEDWEATWLRSRESDEKIRD